MSENQTEIAVKYLLNEVSKTNLYPQLVAQIQKDIHRAGINYDIDMTLVPKDFVLALFDLILRSMQNTFNEYVNLLYAVDVSEKEVRNIGSEKIEDIAGYTTYLILKREWKKVWIRNNL